MASAGETLCEIPDQNIAAEKDKLESGKDFEGNHRGFRKRCRGCISR